MLLILRAYYGPAVPRYHKILSRQAHYAVGLSVPIIRTQEAVYFPIASYIYMPTL